MEAALLPGNEPERLAALADLDILDSDAEKEFDDIARLATLICGTPIGVISLVDGDRQWFKSHVGLDAGETPRGVAFCAHTILEKDVLVVRDASDDRRFADNPLVTGDPGIRFYAGAPLITPEGYGLGTLCVIDREPRDLRPEQLRALEVLRDQVIARLELRRSRRLLEDALRRTSEQLAAKSVLAAELEDAAVRADSQSYELSRKNDLLSAILEAQAGFLFDADPRAAFGDLLQKLLRLTESEYGFIGEVLYRDGAPYLKTRALSNIAWTEETQRLFEKHEREGLEFTNLNTLFGAVMLTGKPIISNAPASDPRRGGLPKGHPALNAFLGLPVALHGELIGMLGIGNRREGYDDEFVRYLEPFTATVAALISASRVNARRVEAESSLRASEARLAALLERERAVRRDVEAARSDLAAQHQRLATLIATLQAGVLVEDEDRRIVLVNQALCDLFGINADPDELVGVPCLDALLQGRSRPLDVNGFVGRIASLRAQRLAVLAEEVAMRQDVALERDYVPIRVDASYRGHLWMYRDVSERRAVADERERLLAAEQEARLRAEAAQAQLEQQNEQLRQLDRLKDEFVASVSHELRTPLTSIISFAELLRDTDGMSQEAAGFLDVIDRNAARLLRLVGDLLLLARLESGEVSLEREPCSLKTILEETVEAIRLQAAARGVSLVLATEDCGPNHEVDRVRLGQLFDNLLSNAVKFTPPGGSVTVAGGFIDGACRVRVSDTGIGIPAEEQAGLFQRFFRASNATSAAVPGTGLGLAIVRAIADLHNAEVHLESEAGVGTTVEVIFPRAAAGERAA